MGATEKKEGKQKSGGISGFFKGVKAEFKKIIWPTKDSLTKQTLAVIVISAVLCGFIKLFDVVVQLGIGLLR